MTLHSSLIIPPAVVTTCSAKMLLRNKYCTARENVTEEQILHSKSFKTVKSMDTRDGVQNVCHNGVQNVCTVPNRIPRKLQWM